MLLDWDLALPWWVCFGAGFVLAVVISFLVTVGDSRKIKQLEYAARRKDHLLSNSNSMIENLNKQVELYKAQLDRVTENVDITLAKRLASLDSYKNAWEKVLSLLKTLNSKLDNHESANIMERSLIQSLRINVGESISLVNSYLIEGIDPDGTARKTVKTGTSGGDSDGQERIQTSDEEPQKH